MHQHEQVFRFAKFSELMEAGSEEQACLRLSRLERGFVSAADFDADYAMQGFEHPFIYRASRIPDAVWFFEQIGAREAALPIQSAFEALCYQLGQPKEDDFGDIIFELLERQPELNTKFERWSDEYGAAGNWGERLENFLSDMGIDVAQFWGDD